MSYEFDKNNHSETVYDYCLQTAKENKLWAKRKNKELNGKQWESACKVSQDMLNEYLLSSIEDLAIKHYKYLQLRSHSFSSQYGSFGYPIDRPAFNKWTELTGEEPKKNNHQQS